MTDVVDRELQAAVEGALLELGDAVRELLQETKPSTPLPRPRTFVVAPDHEWPAAVDRWCDTPVVEWEKIRCQLYRHRLTHNEAASSICEACCWQPAKVLRAVRRIQAAAAWCRARAEGRRRMAENILRSQAAALEAVRAEAALTGLR